jgi:hypothetical protein
MGVQQFPIPASGIPSGTTAARPASPSTGDVFYNGTIGTLEIYTGSGWNPAGAVPDVLTIGTATAVSGSGRAFSDAAVDIAFTNPLQAGIPTSYIATSSPSGLTGTSTSSPVTVAGLAGGTAYTFTVVGRNGYGDSPVVSGVSNSVTPTTVPGAPTIGTVTRTSNTVVSVPFTAPASTGGSAITSYTVTSNPSISLTVTGGTTSPLTATGTFVKGTVYTFTVSAVNANGTSTPSAASGPIYVFPYSIGDIGAGGGKIFYDAGSTQSWGRFLEAATSATSPAWTDTTAAWSGNTNTLVGTNTAIGTGYANTLAAIAQNNTAGRAITLSQAFTGGGKTDWFLPSINELSTMFGQNTALSLGMSAGFYNSSSEHSATASKAWITSGNYEVQPAKNNTGMSIRPIRYN